MKAINFAAALLIVAVLAYFPLAKLHDTPRDPVYDQRAMLTYDMPARGYPPLQSGVSSYLVAQALRLVRSHPVTLNTMAQLLAAALYLGTGGLLAFAITRRWQYVALWSALLTTSGFVFLWLSTELFAGAWLMAYLALAVLGWPFPLRALPLAMFAYAKPDLLPFAVLVGAHDIWHEHKQTLRNGVLLAGLLVAFLIPGLVQSGTAYLADTSNRSLTSFAQHYAVLASYHQVGRPVPEPWANHAAYIAAAFGPVSSLGQAVIAHPRRYLDFLALSVSWSIARLAESGLLYLILLAAAGWRYLAPHWQRTLLLFAANLLPILALSFLHGRYQPRFYPLALFVVFATLDHLPQRRRAFVLGGLLLVLGWQVWHLYASEIYAMAFMAD
jgi:hypothetical protein